MRKKSFLIGILALLLFQLTGCLEDPECSSQENEELEFRLFSYEDGSEMTYSIDSVWISQQDSSLYKNVELASGDFTITPKLETFQLNILGENIDGSFTINYEAIPQLIAEDCEVIFIYIDFNLVSTDFDSVAIRNDVDPVSVHIYN